MARIRCARLTEDAADWIGEPAQIKSGYPLLIKFWDSTCLNCLRSMDWLDQMHEVYLSRGLRVVGVHTPEFSFAADPEYVRWRVKRRRLLIPVLIDSQKRNWEAFANRAWPSYWLISKSGYVEGEWVGEGQERAIEAAVRDLLKIKEGDAELPWALDRVDLLDRSCLLTTEWFAGFRAWENGQIVDAPPVSEEATWFQGGEATPDAYALIGKWKADKESWMAVSPGAKVMVRATRGRLGVVAGGGKIGWSSAFERYEEIVADRPQFIDLGPVTPGALTTLEFEPHKTRLYSIVQSFG